MNQNENDVVYIFPVTALIYPVVIALLFSGVIFYGFFYSVCEFISRYRILLSIAFLIILYSVGYRKAKKRYSVKHGIGASLAIGQFIFLLTAAMFKITETANPECAEVFSFATAIILSVLSSAYAVFNYRMTVNAFKESVMNANTLMVVGIIGWLIDAFIVLMI